MTEQIPTTAKRWQEERIAQLEGIYLDMERARIEADPDSTPRGIALTFGEMLSYLNAKAEGLDDASALTAVEEQNADFNLSEKEG